MTTIASDATWTVRGGKFAARKKEVRAGVAYRAGKRCDTYKVPFTAKRG
jgi:hypothetical protein